MSLAEKITRALGGDWHRTYGLISGPGHSPKDRSVSIRDSNTLPDGIVVHSFAGDHSLAIKDWLRELGQLPPRTNNRKSTGKKKQ